ncbi:hypothetical protein MesoLj113b_68700 (plasmid) [Mesorhizobium sp. 113-3-3]|nr:hypothetical protein MesoLj113b_68700 [Mesorhizobium sp. 113-3-3]
MRIDLIHLGSLCIDDAAWDHSVFSKNRARLVKGDTAAKFIAAVLAQPEFKLPSTDHRNRPIVTACRIDDVAFDPFGLQYPEDPEGHQDPLPGSR